VPSSRKPHSSLKAYLATLHGYQPIEWIRTGMPAFDLVVGAGIPRGRFIEVGGEPSTAKSALLYVIIAAFQRSGGECVLIDSEGKADRVFMELLGVDFERLHYHPGETMGACIDILRNVAKMATVNDLILIGWDSVAATPLAGEFETAGDEEKKVVPGVRARYLSEALRGVLGELTRKKVTVVALNQLRTQFNFMGSTSLVTPGGKAPKFAAALRLMTRMRGKIKHKERDVITGMLVEVEAIKNQVAPPFRKCQVRFNFDTGFAPYSGLDELLLRHGRLEQKAGWLCFKDRTFHTGDIERVIAEMPDLILPLDGVLDHPSRLDLGSGDLPKAKTDTKAAEEETADAQ